MAIYRCARKLIDPVNHLELPFGSYVITECDLWAKRFGNDLQPVGAAPTTSGILIRTLTGLQEESSPVAKTEVVEPPKAVTAETPKTIPDAPKPASPVVTRKTSA